MRTDNAGDRKAEPDENGEGRPERAFVCISWLAGLSGGCCDPRAVVLGAVRACEDGAVLAQDIGVVAGHRVLLTNVDGGLANGEDPAGLHVIAPSRSRRRSGARPRRSAFGVDRRSAHRRLTVIGRCYLGVVVDRDCRPDARSCTRRRVRRRRRESEVATREGSLRWIT